MRARACGMGGFLRAACVCFPSCLDVCDKQMASLANGSDVREQRASVGNAMNRAGVAQRAPSASAASAVMVSIKSTVRRDVVWPADKKYRQSAHGANQTC